GGLARRHRLLGQSVRETATRREFEDQVRLVVVLADRVDGGDIWVAQPCDSPCLGPEPVPLLWGRPAALDDRLDGDDPVEVLVARLVNGPHAPATDPGQRLMAGERRQRRIRSFSLVEIGIRELEKDVETLPALNATIQLPTQARIDRAGPI